MSTKLFKVFAVVFAAVVLSACSGNINNSQANCAKWDENFVDDNGDGKADSPVSCEEMAKKAEKAIDESKQARIEGVCYDVAAENTKGGKPVIVQVDAANKLWQYKWVDAFGAGYQDCSQAQPWAYFEALYQAGKVVSGK